MNAVDSKFERIFQLSPMQEGLLFDSLMSNDGSFVLQIGITTHNGFNWQIFVHSLSYLVNKYEMLRAGFVYKKVKRPFQVIYRERQPESYVLSDYENMEDYRQQDLRRGFQLDHDSLIRCAYSPREGLVLLTIHHIIVDGWSLALLKTEIQDAYGRLWRGEPLPNFAGQPSFEEYVTLLQQKDQAEAEQYWLKQLETAECFIKSDASKHTELSTTVHRFADSLYQRLKELTTQRRWTLSTICECAFAYSLANFSNSPHLAYSKIVSGRELNMAEIERLVGPVFRAQPASVDFTKDKTWSELFSQQQTSWFDEVQLRPLSLAEIKQRQPQLENLTETLFIFENFYEPDPEEDLVTNHFSYDLENEKTSSSLTFSFYEDNGLFLELANSLESFSADEAQTLMNYMEEILTSIALDPDQSISRTRLCRRSTEERELAEIPNIPEHLSLSDILPGMWQDHAQRMALRDSRGSLSYQEMQEQVELMASNLADILPSSHLRIGIHLPKSNFAITAILAVWAYGGSYVPLDLDMPLKRKSYIISNASLDFVITEENLPNVKNLSPSDLLRPLNDYSGFSWAERSHDQEAYVIFTSGSTGNPKGVVLEDEGIARLSLILRDNLSLTSQDRVMQFANYSFDISIGEFMQTLVSGACLVSPDSDTIHDTRLMEHFLARESISVLYFPPDYAELISFDNLPSLRAVVNGAALPAPSLAHRVPDRIKFYNHYGPTETTVFSLLWERPEGWQGDRVPIGRVIDHQAALVMSADGRLKDYYALGELCICGRGLARGYLNQPDKTAAVFVENSLTGQVIYHTGDLARKLPDGTVLYYGRQDQQVKIRGYRVELSEIAECLKRCDSSIIECAAHVWNDTGNNGLLVAYYVSKKELDENLLRSKMAEELTDYMVPVALKRLEVLPRTPSGKLDRKMLPKLTFLDADVEEAKGEVETKIAACFKRVLQLESVDRATSFVSLGGHSLQAIRLLNELEVTFGKRISLKKLYGHATIQELAPLFEEKQETCELLPDLNGASEIKQTPSQKRIYLLEVSQEVGLLYHIPESYKLQRPISFEELASALTKLIEIHPALRTGFYTDGENVYQKVEDEVDLPLARLHFETEAEKTAAWERFVAPFDLDKAPLFRMALVDLNDCQEIWLDIHHIISDAQSSNILIRDLEALLNKQSLSTPAYNYLNYSLWVDTRDQKADEDFWINLFKDYSSNLEIPGDYTRTPEKRFNSATLRIDIPQTIVDMAGALAEELSMSSFSVFLTAFSILASRYTNDPKIVIGMPVAGRDHPALQDMLGVFINTLAIPFEVSDEESFRSTLIRSGRLILDCLDHSLYPFEELIEKVDHDYDPLRTPLFDLLFNYHLLQDDSDGLLTYLEKAAPFPNAKYDMSFTLFMPDPQNDRQTESYLECEYRSGLWKQGTIQNLLDYYVFLLGELLKAPERALKEVSVSTKRYQEICAVDSRQPLFSPQLDLRTQLEKSFSDHASRVALRDPNCAYSYSDLAKEVNDGAQILLHAGVTKGDKVGVLAEKSCSTVIAFLASIFAGASYVPLDPHNSLDRQKEILSDSSITYLLGQTESAKNTAAELGLEYLDLRRKVSTKLPLPLRGSDSTAYVMFTSGSTGRPKGVAVSDHNILYLVDELQAFTNIRDWHILQIGSLGFDAATHEMFSPLCLGGSLNFLEELSPEGIENAISEYGVKQAWVTAALLHQLIDEERPIFDQLDCVITGGQALSPEHAKRFKKLHRPDVKLYNGYGPTETTTFATFHLVEDCDLPRIPIGRPLPNSLVYVCQNGRLCENGMPGELWIGGEGVSQGYINDANLTCRKFCQNPFGSGRIYKSGDLVRRLEDGSIDFLGRLDKQVKLRGFRIELGEIESVLRKVTGVRQAVVILHEDGSEAYLLAYLTGDYDLSQVEASLDASLPSYMHPTQIIHMDALPLKTSGKIDTAKLPHKLQQQSKLTPIETAAEEAVAGAFQSVLGLEKIGKESDFFRAGGDSIKAIRLVTKFKKAGYQVNIQQIMKLRTVQRLASALIPLRHEENQASQKTVVGAMPLTPAMQNLVFDNPSFKHPEYFNQSLAIELERPLSREGVAKLMDSILAHHDILRAVLVRNQLHFRDPSTKDMYFYEELIPADKEELRQLANSGHKRFDLSRQLIGVQQVSFEGRFYLHLIIHHLLVDVVSWHILEEDIQDLLAGRELPPKTCSYQEWAQISEHQYGHAREEEDYWSDIINSDNAGKSAEARQPIEKLQESKLSLSSESTALLLHECQQAYNTSVEDLLLSALLQLRKQDTSVVMESHGRTDQPDVSRTVGWFTALYPQNFKYYSDLEEQIIEVKEKLRSVPNQGVGYLWLYPHQLSGEFSFNYLGEMDDQKGLDWGDESSPDNVLPFETQLNMYVADGELHIQVSESAEQSFSLENYLRSIEKIIEFTKYKQSSFKTTSDIETSGVSMNELNQLANLLGGY